MTEKKFLNSLIHEMNGSDNPVVYGTDLYLQFVQSWNNPKNDYSDYERDVKNIENVEVKWNFENDVDDIGKVVHVFITRKNGKKCMMETLVNSNPYDNFYKMI